jgi:DHA2 family methylenomycin A resistance protein-like MFS transporter
MAAGLALLAVVTSTAAPLVIAALMLPVGVAGPLIAPPITSVLLNSVPDALAGTASGVFNTSRQLGGALAVAVFGALLSQPAGFIHGLRVSLTIAAAVALAAAAASRLLDTSPTSSADRSAVVGSRAWRTQS